MQMLPFMLTIYQFGGTPIIFVTILLNTVNKYHTTLEGNNKLSLQDYK